MYYNVIDDYNLVCSSGYINQWTTAVQEDVATGNILSYNNEAFSLIPYASDSKKYQCCRKRMKIIGSEYKET